MLPIKFIKIREDQFFLGGIKDDEGDLCTVQAVIETEQRALKAGKPPYRMMLYRLNTHGTHTLLWTERHTSINAARAAAKARYQSELAKQDEPVVATHQPQLLIAG